MGTNPICPRPGCEREMTHEVICEGKLVKVHPSLWLCPATVQEHRISELEALPAQQAQRIAEMEAQSERDERDCLAVIYERDQYHEAADKLAYAIAGEEVIGEHSSDNNPWINALEELDRQRAVYGYEWQLIETAPSDGTTIDAYCDWAEMRETDVHWNGQKWVKWESREGWQECFPTHWRPIPPPPKGDPHA